ncbi:MAG TPA: PQQ-dependent sugar dehydrogenase [Bacteroidales bacterium]|nr:PQQ-dependent sugar dehydrogenase [Bacteroidales bacterium]
MKQLLILVIASVMLPGCSNGSEMKIKPDSNNGGLILPDGFSAIVVAEDLGRGRHITVKDNGDIYVSLRRLNEGNGAVALRDTTGDGRADVVKYFGSVSGTGIELHNGYLYYGVDSMIVRYAFENQNDLLPREEYEVIAGQLVDEGQHASKPFEFDGEGNMYVTIGAPSNACMEQMRTKGSSGMDPCPILDYAGGIWRFSEHQNDQTQEKDGYRYATGIRHAVALRWNDKTEKLYTVQHGRDQLHQFFPEIYDTEASAELPAEEFLMLEDGADFGWPYCYYDQIQETKVLAPEYGGDGSKIGRCETKTDPIMAFPGHIAPNDLVFYHAKQFPAKYQNGAFIAFHGSWNRAPEPQEGYNVTFVPFDGDLPSGDWETFADGFSQLEMVQNPGDAVYRPCGLSVGPDGSLYVVDSRQGKVWRIFYNG